MKKYFKFILLCLLTTLPINVMANKTLYVQSVKANVLANPSFKATLVTKLSKGEKVSVVSQKTHWYEVKVNNHSGWVAAMLLAPTQPLKKSSVLKRFKISKKTTARKRASIQATAAATRGLRSERSRANTNENANYQALDKIEESIVNEQEVQKFHKELVVAD
jgi:uncharacterized protein YgiM (DUF1202 family)